MKIEPIITELTEKEDQLGFCFPMILWTKQMDTFVVISAILDFYDIL